MKPLSSERNTRLICSKIDAKQSMGRYSSRVETAKFTSSHNDADSQGNEAASSSDIHYHEEGVESTSEPEF